MTGTDLRTSTEIWHSLHVHRYARIDEFLVDILAPALAPLRESGAVRGWFFLRYWQGGHHIRVRVRTTREDSAEVMASLTELLHAGLVESPSGADFDVAAFQTAQPTMAALENEQVEDVRPDDTIWQARYEPELHKYGGPVGVALAERFFERSSDIAVDTLRASAGRNSRLLGSGFAMMLRGLSAAGLSAREMAAFFEHYCLLWSPYTFDQFLSTWPELLAARRTAMQAHTEAFLADPARSADPFTEAMTRFWSEVDLRAQEILPAISLAGREATSRQRRRVLAVSCLHTHNNRLGLIPEHESFLGFLGHHVLSACAGIEARADLPAEVRRTRAQRLGTD